MSTAGDFSNTLKDATILRQGLASVASRGICEYGSPPPTARSCIVTTKVLRGTKPEILDGNEHQDSCFAP